MAFDANDLSPHEHFVIERTRAGEITDFTPIAAGEKPPLRAGFLRKLMLGLDPSWTVQSPGVRIRGAAIEGVIDLADCARMPALSLIGCDLRDPVDLSHAVLSRLSLRGSRLKTLIAAEARLDSDCDLAGVTPFPGDPGAESLTADLRGACIGGNFIATGAKLARPLDRAEPALLLQNARIAGALLLNEGFEAFGCVVLERAAIGASIACDAGRFLNRADDGRSAALVLDDAEIGGNVGLAAGFLAEGEVRLESAKVGGDVLLEGALIRNSGGCAIDLRNADIAGDLVAHAGEGSFRAQGAIRLAGAHIGRDLNLRGAEIVHAISRDVYGRAVDAPSLRVGGAALFQGANVKGELFLADARIDGYLAFGAGRFIHGGSWAIRAPNVRVGGNLTFKIPEDGFAPHGQKTVIEGGAKFDRALIEGCFGWSALELRGPGPEREKGAVFSFADARIAGPLSARALTLQQDARVVAAGASCAALDDDVRLGWGVEGAALDLDGFSYGRIESEDRWRQRLVWLRRAKRHSPQPFAQLAQVYARAGRREDARRIQLAQQDLGTAQASSGPFTWALSSLFGLIAGYGLAPIRAARALLLYLALGIAGVIAMNDRGALVTPAGAACNGAIEPALYAIDVALPVIDLGQERRCGPGRAPGAQLAGGVAVGETEWRLFEGAALWQWAHALYALAGAILAALALITFSGALKPRDA